MRDLSENGHQPCPFCGSDDVTMTAGWTFSDVEGECAIVVCGSCGASGAPVEYDLGDYDEPDSYDRAVSRAWELWDKRDENELTLAVKEEL